MITVTIDSSEELFFESHGLESREDFECLIGFDFDVLIEYSRVGFIWLVGFILVIWFFLLVIFGKHSEFRNDYNLLYDNELSLMI